MPQPQREIAERIDALAAKTLPDLQRAVKWGMAYCGGGWCFASGMGKATRGVAPASVTDLDERLAASWMKQAAARLFIGGKETMTGGGYANVATRPR